LSFWRLARVPIALIALSLFGVAWTIYQQLWVLPESEVLITTEVTIGMVTFALMNVVMMGGRIYAAWTDREREEQ
jgi:hypothetical protein